ncbi:MAG: hypothetical protein DRR08_03305 [Candidatus Parabeggiatoa sp. nov. 2]|nr:MAG: hypothetical protein B6247_20125 [Beggiatoa sp. 4572_84]RKZ63460.1 MAG: hypothetical protein DRR08_03305 [Gammaproteobacteria bacterium]
MTAHTITLALPEPIYQHLQNQAQITTRPLNDVIFQILSQTLPPEVEEDLPFNYRIELESMAHLSDDVLWQIAQSTMNQEKVALYDILLARHKTGQLTQIGQKWLTQLREDAEQLMLRKAHAYAIIKNRGHQLPTLEELREQS